MRLNDCADQSLCVGSGVFWAEIDGGNQVTGCSAQCLDANTGLDTTSRMRSSIGGALTAIPAELDLL